MQRRLDPEMGGNKPFENVSWDASGVFKIFFRKGPPNFVAFSCAVFPAELVLNSLSAKNDSRRVRGIGVARGGAWLPPIHPGQNQGS